jgi:hypothetical protein
MINWFIFSQSGGAGHRACDSQQRRPECYQQLKSKGVHRGETRVRPGYYAGYGRRFKPARPTGHRVGRVETAARRVRRAETRDIILWLDNRPVEFARIRVGFLSPRQGRPFPSRFFCDGKGAAEVITVEVSEQEGEVENALRFPNRKKPYTSPRILCIEIDARWRNCFPICGTGRPDSRGEITQDRAPYRPANRGRFTP